VPGGLVPDLVRYQPALVNGAAWAPLGRPRAVFSFTITRGKIVEVAIFADPEVLRQLDLAILDLPG
jgi:hypothetical protein